MIIYKATNKVNNKSYIGQTIYTLEKRKSGHLHSVRNNSTVYFHNAIRKYGEENFTWEVIDDTAKTIGELNLLEQKYIKEYYTFRDDPECNGYNLTAGGEGGDTLSNHPNLKEIREKISVNISGEKNGFYGKTHSKETKERIRKCNTGRKCTIETKLKMRNSHIGMTHSTATIQKIRKSKLGKKHKIVTCPKCGKSGGFANMKRYHFNKCGIKEKIKCPYCFKTGGSGMKAWHFENCNKKQ